MAITIKAESAVFGRPCSSESALPSSVHKQPKLHSLQVDSAPVSETLPPILTLFNHTIVGCFLTGSAFTVNSESQISGLSIARVRSPSVCSQATSHSSFLMIRKMCEARACLAETCQSTQWLVELYLNTPTLYSVGNRTETEIVQSRIRTIYWKAHTSNTFDC